jgi:hypothetical protein
MPQEMPNTGNNKPALNEKVMKAAYVEPVGKGVEIVPLTESIQKHVNGINQLLTTSDDNEKPQQILDELISEVAKIHGVNEELIRTILDVDLEDGESLSTSLEEQEKIVELLHQKLRERFVKEDEQQLRDIEHALAEEGQESESNQAILQRQRIASLLQKQERWTEEKFQKATEQAAAALQYPLDLVQELAKTDPSAANNQLTERQQGVLLTIVANQFEDEVAAMESDNYKKFWHNADNLRGIDTTDLIDCASVSEKQKEAWRKMMMFDFPRDIPITVVALHGAHDFETDEECAHIQSSLEKYAGRKVEVREVDNTKPKEEVLAMLNQEALNIEEGYVLFYFSSHGTSQHMGGAARPNSETDDFLVMSGNQEIIDSCTESAKKAREQYFIEHPEHREGAEARNAEINGEEFLSEGSVVTIGEETMTIPMDISDSSQFVNFLFNYYINKGKADTGISMSELVAIQQKMDENVENEGGVKRCYMFDNCHAGSALHEGLMQSERTDAVFASSATEQFSYSNAYMKGRGNYMHKVFQFIGQGYSPGESYVRADIAMNGLSKNMQNPKATIRDNDGAVMDVALLSNVEDQLNV